MISRVLQFGSILWNLADISKLRGSSGQDFLLCNSNLKTQVGLQLTVTAKKCFAFHNIRDKCMTHSNTSATIGYLKKVFLLDLSRSSRLDTISLLKLSRTYQFYKDIHLIVHQMKECTVEFFRRSNGYSCSAQLPV